MLNMRNRFNTNTKYIKLAIRYFSTIDFDSGIYIDDLRIEPLKITTSTFAYFNPASIFQVSSDSRNIWNATGTFSVDNPGTDWVLVKLHDEYDMKFKEYNDLNFEISYSGGPSSMYMDIRVNCLLATMQGRYITISGMFTETQHLLFTRNVWQSIYYTFTTPLRVLFLQGVSIEAKASSNPLSILTRNFYLNGNSWNFVA
jgi:hypothetical protein